MTSTPSRSLADERGSLLIEVLVSAVLVAVIGVALFGALNSAAQVSGKSKTRAGAAAVAQDDQERMRAMPVATLNNFRSTATPSSWARSPTSSTRAPSGSPTPRARPTARPTARPPTT